MRVFFDITLPIIAPALVSGWLLAFTLSLDDLVIASFVSGPGSSTLPMVIFSKVRLGVSPEVNALATIIIGVVAAGVFVATILQLRRPRADEGLTVHRSFQQGPRRGPPWLAPRLLLLVLDELAYN